MKRIIEKVLATVLATFIMLSAMSASVFAVGGSQPSSKTTYGSKNGDKPEDSDPSPTLPEDPEPPTVIRGDFNNDGVLNAADSIYLKKHIALPSRYPLIQSGDINGDGVVNSQDAIYLKKHIALPSRYPLH